MQEAIFTPRSVVRRILKSPTDQNPQACTKVPYKGFEVSIAMDSSHCTGDLSRSDLAIYQKHRNVTYQLLPQYEERGSVPATAETLLEAFAAIDKTLSSAPDMAALR